MISHCGSLYETPLFFYSNHPELPKLPHSGGKKISPYRSCYHCHPRQRRCSHIPLYLTCIENQTVPKKKIYLYIRNNNNKDTTAHILRAWVDRVKNEYADVYFDDTDLPEKGEKNGLHQSNKERFKVLGAIRQDSINWAKQRRSHYFVADCDTFIKPHTLQSLLEADKPVVAPLLHKDKKGLTEAPVIHGTYLVQHEFLNKVCYDDNASNGESNIFSKTLKKYGIPEFIDTREVYGYLSDKRTAPAFYKWRKQFFDEPWLAPTPSELGAELFLKESDDDYITIAILAKDMAHVLPVYLTCIENQTWPHDKTYLYIRTNNNNDNTTDILRSWVNKVKDTYADIYFDDTDVPEKVQRFGLHDMEQERFKVLGAIRQASVDWAREHNSHYFVVDCDNFIKPHTLETLFKTNKPIIAPFLRRGKKFRNNDHSTYFTQDQHHPDCFKANNKMHKALMTGEIRDITQVPIVHCTYLLRKEILDKVCFDDGSGCWEFIILSKTFQRHNIPQFLDNREIYGYLTDKDTALKFNCWLTQFADEPWIRSSPANTYQERYQQKPYLWVYWENCNGRTTPGYISLCRKTMIKHCSSSFTIVELDNNNIYDYLPEMRDLEQKYDLSGLWVAQRSDIYRLLLLYKFGGLYLDAGTIVMRNLKEIADKLCQYDYIGFGDYNQEERFRYGNPENWIMASRPQGVFITHALKALEEVLPHASAAHYHCLGRSLLSVF